MLFQEMLTKKKKLMWQYKTEVYDLDNEKLEENKKIRKNEVYTQMLIWELIFTFNWLESDIEDIFSKLVFDDADELWMMILGSMNYHKRCEILRSYVLRWLLISKAGYYEDKKQQRKHDIRKQRIEKLEDKVKNIYQELLDIGEFRNKVVHWFWEEQDEYWFLRNSNTLFWEKWIIIQHIKIVNKDIKNYIKKIYNIRNKIRYILEEFENIRYI